MFIENVRAKSIRCFKSVSVALVHPDAPAVGADALPNVTLLLGGNGTPS
jgi:hypothetical protein